MAPRKPTNYLLIGLLCLLGAAVLDATSHRTEMLLVATEQMRDGRFSKSVIIIGGNWLTGWSGVIVNKPLEAAEKQDVPEFIRNLNHEVGYGGPIGFPEKFYVLERHDDPGTGKATGFHLKDWTAALRAQADLPELIRKDAADHTNRYRIFSGYSGWAPIQLENEFTMSNSWEGMPPEPDLVWKTGPETTWESVRQKQKDRLKRPMRTL